MLSIVIAGPTLLPSDVFECGIADFRMVAGVFASGFVLLLLIFLLAWLEVPCAILAEKRMQLTNSVW